MARRFATLGFPCVERKRYLSTYAKGFCRKQVEIVGYCNLGGEELGLFLGMPIFYRLLVEEYLIS